MSVDSLFADPDFQSHPRDAQMRMLGSVLEKNDPGYAKLAPDRKPIVAERIYSKRMQAAAPQVAPQAAGPPAPPSGLAKYVPALRPPRADYDPTLEARLEGPQGGALQQPLVDPVDIATFGTAGAAEAAGKVALEEGTSLLGKEALTAGAREAGKVATGFPLSAIGQKAVAPISSALKQKGPVGELAGGVVDVVGGAAPFAVPDLAAGTARGMGRALVGKEDIEQAARAPAEEMTGKAVTAKQEFEQAKQDVGAKARVNYDALHKKIANTAVKEAEQERQAAIKTSVGAGPPATMEHGPARIQRGEEFTQGVSAPIERWRGDWAERRNERLKGYLDNQVDDGPLRERMANEAAKWPPTHRPYSPKVQNFLDRMGAQAVGGDTLAAKEQAQIDKAIREFKISPAQQQQMRQDFAQARANITGQKMAGPKTVGQLLKDQSEAGALARASKGADRTAAMEVQRGIDDTLAQANIPALKDLNKEYADHRANFPYAYEDKVRGAARPVDVAPDIFDSPQRALDLYNLGTPDEQRQLKGLYATWVHDQGPKVVSRDHGEFLQRAYAGTPLAKPEAWTNEIQAINSLSDLAERSPIAARKMQARLENARQVTLAQNDSDIIESAQKLAKTMGPTGKRIQQTIDAAHTPAAKKAAALQAFHLLDPAKVGEEAAVKALGGYTPGGAGMMNRLKFYAQRNAVLGLPLLAAGHAYPIEAAAAAGTVVGIREGLAGAYRYVNIGTPERAAQFYRAMMEPGTPKNLDTIAQTILEAQVASKLGHSPDSPLIHMDIRKTPEEMRKGPGPMSRAVERKEAEQVVSGRNYVSPEHIDNIEKTNSQIASGDQPNVQRSLNDGRLSVAEVRKMVEPKPANVAGMFHGMSLPNAIEAFSKGAPHEKELAFSTLAQKIQDEGRALPPDQKQALLSQLRRAMGQEGAMAG